MRSPTGNVVKLREEEDVLKLNENKLILTSLEKFIVDKLEEYNLNNLYKITKKKIEEIVD